VGAGAPRAAIISVSAFEDRTDPDPNAKTPNAITMNFSPHDRYPSCFVSAIELHYDCEVAEGSYYYLINYYNINYLKKI